SVRLRAERGTLTADLFHGFAVTEAGGVSRGRKLMRPFRRSGGELASAAANLAVRALRGGTAYPGLRALTAAVYRAASTGAPPFSPGSVLAVAEARDRWIAAART